VKKLLKIGTVLEAQARINKLGLGDKFTFDSFKNRIEALVGDEIIFIPDSELEKCLPDGLTGFATYAELEGKKAYVVCYNSKYTGRNLMLVILHELNHIWLGDIKKVTGLDFEDVVNSVHSGKPTAGIVVCREESNTDEHEKKVDFFSIDLLDHIVTEKELNIIRAIKQLL
jgi:hypothetical protein